MGGSVSGGGLHAWAPGPFFLPQSHGQSIFKSVSLSDFPVNLWFTKALVIVLNPTQVAPENLPISRSLTESHRQSPLFHAVCCCGVTKSCLVLCDPEGCSVPGFPVLYALLEGAAILGNIFSGSKD